MRCWRCYYNPFVAYADKDKAGNERILSWVRYRLAAQYRELRVLCNYITPPFLPALIVRINSTPSSYKHTQSSDNSAVQFRWTNHRSILLSTITPPGNITYFANVPFSALKRPGLQLLFTTKVVIVHSSGFDRRLLYYVELRLACEPSRRHCNKTGVPY